MYSLYFPVMALARYARCGQQSAISNQQLQH
jgi:hypothetical protein